MKNFYTILSVLLIGTTAIAVPRGNVLSRFQNNRASTSETVVTNRSDSIYSSIRQLYSNGKISADSVVSLALYHKVWSPQLAGRCLELVADKSPRGTMELGVLYAFYPDFSKHISEGVILLQTAAQEGMNDANCYLGLYYFNKKDYKKAKASFDSCHPIEYGFGYTALGSMYVEGKGVAEDLAKARENYRQGALQGYPRGAALYGFNLRASAAGKINYPDSFFWIYVAGDLGDDAARATLGLPLRNESRGDSEVAKDANTAIQLIAMANSGKKIQNDPIYKEGFLPGLKAREAAAEQGDDWSRYYLGSMNFNGDFLNQNYARAIYYYEPIARNGKLPKTVLAVVNDRLAKMYSEGKGVKANPVKAARYAKAAAKYGSLSAYKTVERITE